MKDWLDNFVNKVYKILKILLIAGLSITVISCIVIASLIIFLGSGMMT